MIDFTNCAVNKFCKDFYQTMITERKEKILDYSMALRMKQGLPM